MSGIFYTASTHIERATERETEREMEREWVRQTDWYIAISFKKRSNKTSHLVTAARFNFTHSRLLSGFSYSVQDILIQPPRWQNVRFLAIFQRRAIKPVGTGIRGWYTVYRWDHLSSSQLLSIVMLSNTPPPLTPLFHTSSNNQQLIKIIAALIFKANHFVYCPDQ